MIILSSVLITLALIFYSLGIWSERFAKILKPWHVVTFWIGFSFDVSGTWIMRLMSQGHFNIFSAHTWTGQLALWLMLIHAIWATIVIIRGKIESKQKFHRYSIFVWLVWLIPYFGGMYLGMSK